MKATVVAVVFLAGGGSAAAATSPSDKPQRVMSINQCTDQIVLQLLPHERITSVTYLSRASARAYLTAEASGVPINYGTSEEILRQNPDLVLSGDFTTPAARALLKKAGVPLVEVPGADNFPKIRAVVRLVANAVGEEQTGESLIEKMNQTLRELERTAPTKPITVASWYAAGGVPGTDTLFDAILTAAGGVNLAARASSSADTTRLASFDLEQLLLVRPDVLVFGSTSARRLDLYGEQLQHPVIRKLYAGRQITYPETLYECGLPQSADAARQLREAMLAAMAR